MVILAASLRRSAGTSELNIFCLSNRSSYLLITKQEALCKALIPRQLLQVQMLTCAQLPTSQRLLLCRRQPRHLLESSHLHPLEVLLCLVDNCITQILIDNSFMIINFQYLFFACSLDRVNVRMHLSEFLLFSRFLIVVIGHYSLFSVEIACNYFLSSISDDVAEPNTFLKFDNV